MEFKLKEKGNIDWNEKEVQIKGERKHLKTLIKMKKEI